LLGSTTLRTASNARNTIEATWLAYIADALLKQDPYLALELVARRLIGVVEGDSSGVWDIATELDPHRARRIGPDSLLKQVRATLVKKKALEKKTTSASKSGGDGRGGGKSGAGHGGAGWARKTGSRKKSGGGGGISRKPWKKGSRKSAKGRSGSAKSGGPAVPPS
jgi:hypothetical protein